MHTEIKTYSLVDENNQPALFKLQTMEQIEERMAGTVDSPHRHDYYTIVLVKEGAGKHFIDFKEYAITANSIFFIYPGQVHQVIPEGLSKGWVLTFTNEFLVRSSITEQLINDVYLYNNFGESPPLSLHDHEVEAYELLIKQIMNFYNDGTYSIEAKGSLLKLFLIKSHNLCTLSKNIELQSIEHGNPLLRSFKKHIDKYFTTKHKVSDYANMLTVTSDYLNKVVKSLTGKSAKEYIQNRIVVEAKRTLLFTELSNKELSYQLGFEEPSHFSNFFKKNTGVSPIDFRESARKN